MNRRCSESRGLRRQLVVGASRELVKGISTSIDKAVLEPKALSSTRSPRQRSSGARDSSLPRRVPPRDGLDLRRGTDTTGCRRMRQTGHGRGVGEAK